MSPYHYQNRDMRHANKATVYQEGKFRIFGENEWLLKKSNLDDMKLRQIVQIRL